MCCQVGLGGGGTADAGSGPSLREFRHGGADACTPRQGVTLLYGPSFCTRSVQMDLRRNQVRRPFPTPGSGTLWVSGEPLRDRRVSCLPLRTVCPTRSPSQDTNRSTCRGKCSWSGPLAGPQGRCHLGPLANGPGRNPTFCLRSGGADTDTGGAPKPLRSGTSPASFAGSCHPAPPPRSLRCWSLPPSFVPQGCSPFPRPLPCFLATAVSRLPLLSVPARAHWCPLFFFLAPPPLATRLSPRRFGLSSDPPPMSPRRLLAVLTPFLGGWGRRGWGGGGRPRCPCSGVSTSQARRRHEARPLSLCTWGGGGLAVWLPSSPFLPCVRTPGAPPAGACTARASFGHDRVARPAPSLRCLPTLPLCPRGGGGALSAPPYLHPPPLGGQRCVGGGGGACRLPFVARMSQARRKHHTGMRRGPRPSARGGGACLVAPVVALPTLRSHPRRSPRWGLHGRVVRPAPSRRCLPTLPLCPWGGGRFSPPPTCIPHPWGGGGVCGGGGGGAPVVFPSQHACRRHDASMAQARSAALVPLQGGRGLPCVTRHRPSYPACAPPGGAEVCGEGGDPCRRPFVARMSQARRKHDASTG